MHVRLFQLSQADLFTALSKQITMTGLPFFIAHYVFFLMVYPVSRPIVRQVERECIVSFQFWLFVSYPSFVPNLFILLVSVVAVYTLVHDSQDDCPLARISQEKQVHCRVFAAILQLLIWACA